MYTQHNSSDNLEIQKKKYKGRIYLILLLSCVGIVIITMLLFINRDRFIRYKHYRDYGVYVPENFGFHGIDVSHHQGKINWQAVVNNNSKKTPVSFVFIKATEGLSMTDAYYSWNKKQAKKAGLMTGSYHYLLCDKNGKQQSLHFIKNADLQKGDLAPVIDVEDFNGNRAALISTLKEFIAELSNHCDAKPILYTGANFYEANLSPEFDAYPLWIAHYNKISGPSISRKWHFWQHTEHATVNGINTKVDMNVFNGDSLSLTKLLID